MKRLLIVLLLGLGLGAAGGVYGYPYARPYIDGEVEGVVVSERREGDRLLLILRADDDRTFLATFRERAGDVAELVAVGDTVRLAPTSQGVFADDPPLRAVRRASDEPPVLEDAGIVDDGGILDGAVLDGSLPDGAPLDVDAGVPADAGRARR